MRFLSSLVFCTASLAACSQGPDKSDAGGSDAAGDVAQQNDAQPDAQSDAPSCPSESASISGTFVGLTLTPKDAVSIFSKNNAFIVAVSDYTGLCATANGNKANSQLLVFDYQGGAALPLSTPVDVTTTQGFDVQWAQYDQTCGSPQGESSSSGTVTFTRIDACGVTGTFDLVFNTDHVTGSFGAPACSYDPDAGAPKCN